MESETRAGAIGLPADAARVVVSRRGPQSAPAVCPTKPPCGSTTPFAHGVAFFFYCLCFVLGLIRRNRLASPTHAAAVSHSQRGLFLTTLWFHIVFFFSPHSGFT